MSWRADELESNSIGISVLCCSVSKNNFTLGRLYMAFLDLDWKEKQYAAITRLSKSKGWDFSDNNPYFERAYIFLPRVSIKTKAQMKQELKKHGYK